MQDSFSTLPTDQPSPISLREYGDVLRRRRAIILQTFVIVLVAGVLVTLFQAPVFHSSARLLVQPPSYSINSIVAGDPLADLLKVGNPYSIPTQVELLQTDAIRTEVQKALGGKNMPGLTVAAVEGTSIIQIDSEGDDPESVAGAPNALMDIYCKEQNDTGGKSLRDALDYTTKMAADAHKVLADAEKQLLEFKLKNNIQELSVNESSQMGLVTQLTGDYSGVQQQLDVLDARIAATKEARDTSGPTRPSFLSKAEDPVLQGIEAEIFNATTQVALIKNTLGGSVVDPQANPDKLSPETDPVVVRMLRQVKELKGRKDTLLQQYNARNTHANPTYAAFNDALLQDGIQRSELLVKKSLMEQQLRDAKERLKNFPSWTAQYDSLKRAVASAQQSQELFESKKFDLSLRSRALPAGTTEMETAKVPTTPIRPKKAQSIILGGLLGLFLGLCLALLQELFDDRINNPEEAERVLRVPTLGHIPMIEEEGLRLIRDISTFSPLMEAYRSLRTNINFAAVGSEMRSLVVTSSVPAEGKSTTVANLAMAMALDNKQVIVVDADLRRPSLHKLFKKDASPGLTDLLVGTHTVDEVIQETNVPGVRFIAAGSPPPNPAELLGSASMGHVLEVLEQSCDIVLFDSPPTLAVADAVVLASRTDGAALLIGYGETKKTSTKKAIEILSRANANLLGVILNRIEGQSSGYYYGKYYIPATDRVSTGGAGQSINRSFNVPPPGYSEGPGGGASAEALDEDDQPLALPENNQEDENR